ncbi:MAG TPA: guanylate kinase [Papillibacter sp.]|jgi:guanylate kinase|nr:guanylate kinase [Papillibacter sp.]
MKKNKGRLFIISAPSGTGKSTVIQELMQTCKDLHFSVSATTREARPGEVHGVSYYFITHEEFEKHIRQNDFLEYAEYVGNYYGTLKAPVLARLEEGKDVILDIDVQGCKQIIAAMPEAITIFLVPPSMEELENRLRFRGTDPEDRVRNRLIRAKAEMLEKDSYDYVVVNDIVDKAVAEILDIMGCKQT